MKKRIPDPVLMFITILVISGFQVYWIRDNYFREKKALEIRTNGLFRETVRQVQDSVLKKKLKLVMKDSGTINFIERKNARDLRPARVAALLGEKVLGDSLRKSNVFITLRKRPVPGDTANGKPYHLTGLHPEDIKEVEVVDSESSWKGATDSLRVETGFREDPFPGAAHRKISSHRINTIYFNDDEGRQIVIQIDSLFNDSINISLLSSEYAKVLKAEKLDVPFFISTQEKDSLIQDDEITPGFPFGRFGGFTLKLGNTFSYLVNKITVPILFSIFLVGVTVLSFILLYRTLLKQQRLAAMKNEFISNITHELKTPISTVSVAIEALKNFGVSQSAEKSKEYLAISENELQRLNLLVDKVLKISMFEKREIELRKETFDMQVLVNEVISIMKLQFEKQHAVVNFNTAGENFTIEADRLHITSVLYNLFDNALKYSKQDPVINVLLSALPRDIIELKISDNGIGIAKEYQRRVFDKFFRVPMGNEHSIKGYGLGLSYVNEILHRHMGFIVVDSELGKGTTFTVKIPRKEADEIYFGDKQKMRKKTIRLGFKKDKPA